MAKDRRPRILGMFSLLAVAVMASVGTFVLTTVQTTGQTPAATAGDVTFTRDIAPVLQRSCQECHHAQGVAPMALVTYEDVMEAIEDIADETIAQMAGTGERVREREPTWKRLLARVPWLIVTLFAGLVNVGLMSSLQSYEGGILTFVLFFVPLITGLSGNIGVQCSTVLVRSMATGGLSASTKREAVLKEILIGVSNGVIFGILCGFLVWSLDLLGVSGIDFTPPYVGLILSAGLIGACLAGTFLGVFSPLFFGRIGVDPAIASGPIVTAFNDFLSMSIYFLIAIGLNNLLI